MRSSGGFVAATAAELRVNPEVERDLGEAYAWYEEPRTGLGEDFLGCVDA